MAQRKLPQDVVDSHALRDRSRNEVQKAVLLREVARMRQERLTSLQDGLEQLTQTIKKSSQTRSRTQQRNPVRPKRRVS